MRRSPSGRQCSYSMEHTSYIMKLLQARIPEAEYALVRREARRKARHDEILYEGRS